MYIAFSALTDCIVLIKPENASLYSTGDQAILPSGHCICL